MPFIPRLTPQTPQVLGASPPSSSRIISSTGRLSLLLLAARSYASSPPASSMICAPHWYCFQNGEISSFHRRGNERHHRLYYEPHPQGDGLIALDRRPWSEGKRQAYRVLPEPRYGEITTSKVFRPHRHVSDDPFAVDADLALYLGHPLLNMFAVVPASLSRRSPVVSEEGNIILKLLYRAFIPAALQSATHTEFMCIARSRASPQAVAHAV